MSTGGADASPPAPRGGAAPAANVYDLGALRNAHEVLFPRSRRRDALARYRAKREKGD